MLDNGRGEQRGEGEERLRTEMNPVWPQLRECVRVSLLWVPCERRHAGVPLCVHTRVLVHGEINNNRVGSTGRRPADVLRWRELGESMRLLPRARPLRPHPGRGLGSIGSFSVYSGVGAMLERSPPLSCLQGLLLPASFRWSLSTWLLKTRGARDESWDSFRVVALNLDISLETSVS